MYPTELIEYVMKRTHYKARQVVRQVPSLGDVEDVQHDLAEDVLRRLPKFDGDRAGARTFVCRIINNQIANILKSHNAASRGNGCTPDSLDDWVRDESGGWTRRSATIDQSRLRAHRGVVPRGDRERRELELDVAEALATLPPEQRTLSLKLRVQTPSEVCRATGLSRSAVYKRIAAIRVAFVAAGLHHYL